jgi:hypothetical protein
VWARVVQKHDLLPLALDTLLGQSHFYADMCLAYGAVESPPPIYVSTVKIRQHGFTMACNTEESFCFWLRDLMTRRILPMPDLSAAFRLEANQREPRIDPTKLA